MKIILYNSEKRETQLSVSQPRGDYLIRMGVAKLHVAKVEVEQEEKAETGKKETKPKTKTKK